jgi:hypothetical protein
MYRLITFPLVTLLAVGGQAADPQPKPKVVSSQGAILWKAAHLQSQRFDDEVSPFGRIEMDCDAFPQNEGPTRIRWRFQSQSEPEARKGFALLHANMLLEHEGWVQLSTSDCQQYRRAYKGFPDLGAASREAFIYRPKDEAAFKKAVEAIEMLGSRGQGRRAALVSQLFLLVSLDQFSFENGAAEFMVKFRPLLYGSSLDQSVGGGVDVGEIGSYSYSAAKLLDPIMALFKEHRPRLAPGLDAPTPSTTRPEARRENTAAANPKLMTAPPATESPMAEALRQQRRAFEENRKAVKILALPDGGRPRIELVPICVEVQRPNIRTIQFPAAMDQLGSLPTLVLPSKAPAMLRIQAHPQIAYKQANPHLVYLGEGSPQGRRLATSPDQLPMTSDGMGLDRGNLSLCLPEGDSGIWLLFKTMGSFAPGIYALTFPPISGRDARAELPTRDYYLFRVETPASK